MAERLDEIKVNGQRVASGTEVTLFRRTGLKSGRYRVDEISVNGWGKIVVSVFKLGKFVRQNYVYPEQIKTVHRSKKYE